MLCGEVKNHAYQEGRKVSVNGAELKLKLTNQKCLSDGRVLKKSELFTKDGVLREFFKDGEKIADVVPRLNGKEHHPENWLSMRPETSNWFVDSFYFAYFGELNENNEPHGRGIAI